MTIRKTVSRMEMRRRLFAACSALALFAAPAFARTDGSAQRYLPAALWEWNEKIITDSRAQAAFFAFAGTHQINRVYIECEGAIQKNLAALIGFLQTAADQGPEDRAAVWRRQMGFPGPR